jgi:hypothetical protein
MSPNDFRGWLDLSMSYPLATIAIGAVILGWGIYSLANQKTKQQQVIVPRVLDFGLPHQAADLNVAKDKPSFSWWQIPVVMAPDSEVLERATVRVRLLEAGQIGHAELQQLRWEDTPNGVPERTLDPGRSYLVGVVARYDDGSKGDWAAVITEEGSRRFDTQIVKLPPGRDYHMKLEVVAGRKVYQSPLYVVHVPAAKQNNTTFFVEEAIPGN